MIRFQVVFHVGRGKRGWIVNAANEAAAQSKAIARASEGGFHVTYADVASVDRL